MPSDQREGKFMRKAYLISLSILTFSSSAVFAQGAAPIQKLEDSLAEAINKGRRRGWGQPLHGRRLFYAA
jgi:hypothetical protein